MKGQYVKAAADIFFPVFIYKANAAQNTPYSHTILYGYHVYGGILVMRITVEENVRCAVQDLNTRAKRTVVFVHGWPLGKDIFECQYTVLPEYGIRCVSIDLRGFGASDRPLRGYSYDRMADDLCHCLQELGLRDVTLCGFSMGGAICVRYMSRYKGARVRRLVLMGAACPSFVQRPGYPYGMSREQVDLLISQIYNDRPKAVSEFGKQCFAGTPSTQYLNWFQGICTDAAAWSTIKTAESLRDEDLRADLAKIKVPTAILHGMQDRVCPFQFAQEMNKGIPSSFIVPFEQSGHCLFYEERNKCNSTLIDFSK